MDIQITKSAIKDIKKLDTNTKERILSGINKLPLGDIKRLQGYSDYYRLRIGGYRVIYKFKNGIITISAVLPRGEAYKNI